MNISILYVALALALTVYGHVVLKARILARGPGVSGQDHGTFLLAMFLDPWVISGFAAAVVAAAAWMLALRNADLSFLFPFMALTFVFVPVLASVLFGERISVLQIVGFVLIVGGISLATIGR